MLKLPQYCFNSEIHPSVEQQYQNANSEVLTALLKNSVPVAHRLCRLYVTTADGLCILSQFCWLRRAGHILQCFQRQLLQFYSHWEWRSRDGSVPALSTHIQIRWICHQMLAFPIIIRRLKYLLPWILGTKLKPSQTGLFRCSTEHKSLQHQGCCLLRKWSSSF